MASEIVDGLMLPVEIAGHPVLEFCNTRAGWGSPVPKEYLASHRHLSTWARHAGLIDSHITVPATGRAAADAERVLARAVLLRDAVYALLVGPARELDWDALNNEVRRAAAAARLRPRPGNRSGPPAAWDVSGSRSVERPVLAVAWAAAELLVSPLAAQIGACPGTGCGWLFLDTAGRRRWCSMKWCGNRAKARRYAQRSRATDGEGA